MTYDSSSSVRAARDQYLAANGFSLADYQARWVRFKIGPVPIVFVNTRTRKAAVPLHDLHHLATGYQTDLRGEAEIAAWELAAGCGRYWAAWVLNSMTIATGAVIAPRRTLAAWRRGRRSRSLYHESFQDSLLDLSVAELQNRLELDPR